MKHLRVITVSIGVLMMLFAMGATNKHDADNLDYVKESRYEITNDCHFGDGRVLIITEEEVFVTDKTHRLSLQSPVSDSIRAMVDRIFITKSEPRVLSYEERKFQNVCQTTTYMTMTSFIDGKTVSRDSIAMSGTKVDETPVFSIELGRLDAMLRCLFSSHYYMYDYESSVEIYRDRYRKAKLKKMGLQQE